MEFKFRAIDDGTPPYPSSSSPPPPPSTSLSYFSDQALQLNYTMDPMHDPRGFYTIQRKIEKERIRHELIMERRLLEEEVRRELMMEREMARASKMSISVDERLSMQHPASCRLMHSLNNHWLEDQSAFPGNHAMGFGHGAPTLPQVSDVAKDENRCALEVNKKEKLIMLAKPNPNSKKPKEWSCALCQVSATTERGLNEHLQDKKHKAKVAGLIGARRMCKLSTSSVSKKSGKQNKHTESRKSAEREKHTESRKSADREMKTEVEKESVEANSATTERGLNEHLQNKKHEAKVAGLIGARRMCKLSTSSVSKKSGKQNKHTDSRKSATTKRGLNEHLPDKKHKAKVSGLIRVRRICKLSTSSVSKKSGKQNKHTESRKSAEREKHMESRKSADREMKTEVEKESVEANSATSERGLNEHLQDKKHKAKVAGLIGARRMCKLSTPFVSKKYGKQNKQTESRKSADQEMKRSVEANKTVVGLDLKMEYKEVSENKNEELPKKNENVKTHGKKNDIPTADKTKSKLTNRKNIKFWCEDCQVGAESAVVMDSHKRGKKHMARCNGSKPNGAAFPAVTSMTTVAPSEPSKKAEDEYVVAEEENEETDKIVTEKAEDEYVVAEEENEETDKIVTEKPENEDVVAEEVNEETTEIVTEKPEDEEVVAKEASEERTENVTEKVEDEDAVAIAASEETAENVTGDSDGTGSLIVGDVWTQPCRLLDMLQAKADPSLHGSKGKAATPPAGSGEPPLMSSKKPKRWSCALCQVSATSERDFNVHLHGKKHKAKEAGLIRARRTSNLSRSSESKNSGNQNKLKESRKSADREMNTEVEKGSVETNKTVVGLDLEMEYKEVSENKYEELPKKNKNVKTHGKKNDIPTAEKTKSKLPNRKNFKFWCEDCQVGAESAVVMESHKRGKKHMARCNGSKPNGAAFPAVTSMTTVAPSEPSKKAEDEDVVAEEGNEETTEIVTEKPGNEDVVAEEVKEETTEIVTENPEDEEAVTKEASEERTENVTEKVEDEDAVAKAASEETAENVTADSEGRGSYFVGYVRTQRSRLLDMLQVFTGNRR